MIPFINTSLRLSKLLSQKEYSSSLHRDWIFKPYKRREAARRRMRIKRMPVLDFEMDRNQVLINLSRKNKSPQGNNLVPLQIAFSLAKYGNEFAKHVSCRNFIFPFYSSHSHGDLIIRIVEIQFVFFQFLGFQSK